MVQRKFKTVLETLLKAIVVAGCLYYIGCYLFMVMRRLPYPFELEWLEGYFVAGMARVAAGDPLYAPPNSEFVPFLYPPLYYWITGGLAKLIGAGFWLGRLVSVSASLFSGFLVAVLAYRESGSRMGSCLAAGLFFACYGLSDCWYDVARVDSLFLALTLGGLYLARYHADAVSDVVLAAFFFAMACFTKQSAVFFVIGISFYYWTVHRKSAVIFMLTALLFIGGGNLLMHYGTDGWYGFYSYIVPFKHYGYTAARETAGLKEVYSQYTGLASRDYGSLIKLYSFFVNDLLFTIPVLIAGVAAWCAARYRSKEKSDDALLFCLSALAAALLASISMRCKYGGHINGIIPTVTIIIVCFGIVAGRYLVRPETPPWARMLIFAAVLLQLYMLRYTPGAYIPTREDGEAGRNVIKTIASVEGEVYVPFHSWYPAMAGKKMYVHKMPIEDVFIGYPDRFPRTLVELIAERHFAAILYNWEIDAGSTNPIEQAIVRNYTRRFRLPYGGSQDFIPRTGFRTRPRFMYLP